MKHTFNFDRYIEEAKADDFKDSGINSNRYLDILEKALNAFTEEELLKITHDAENNTLADYQTMARIVCVMAVLISRGRILNYRAIWDRMMSAACKLPCSMKNNAHLDFGIKDIMTAYLEMEKYAKPEQLEQWREGLKKINPYKQYYCVRTIEKPIQHNINVYNISGEILRGIKGLCDPAKYLEEQLPYQLENCFDENGMYDDGPQPMLYDLTTRVQIQLALQYGYQGKFAEDIDNKLKPAALYTLFTQSAAFEFPTGGRSNQYLFNEALIASCCEFEASRYHRLGEYKKAGMFKRAAHLAILAINRWLEQVPPKHIKNNYPWHSAYGTDGYGFYNKYFISMGSFLVPAILAADDNIREFPCPAELGGYVLETSKRFHRIFANCGGYSIQIDHKPDEHYDCKGISRLHKKDIATETALSGSIVKHPQYSVNPLIKSIDFADSIEASKILNNQKAFANPSNMSINPSICFRADEWLSLANAGNETESSLRIIAQSTEMVKFEIKYSGKSLPCTVVEKYIISPEGVVLKASYNIENAVAVSYEVPVIITNGKVISEVNVNANSSEVLYLGGRYRISSSGSCTLEDKEYYNRNGTYKIIRCSASGKNEITIKLTLEKLIV